MLWAALAAAIPAAASVQLEIHYPVLEKALARQAFTQDGRRYVRGSKDSKCSFAYLENPRISASAGRLVIKARFSGRSALDLFGACVGVGDSFDLTLTATPHHEDGALRLRDVRAETSAIRGVYVTGVLRALEEGIPRDFAYPVSQAAREILEQPRDAGYSQQVSGFHVVSVQAGNQALVLVLDFKLVVR